MLTGEGGISFAVSSFNQHALSTSTSGKRARERLRFSLAAPAWRTSSCSRISHSGWVATPWTDQHGQVSHGQTSEDALDFRMEICVRHAPTYYSVPNGTEQSCSAWYGIVRNILLEFVQASFGIIHIIRIIRHHSYGPC